MKIIRVKTSDFEKTAVELTVNQILQKPTSVIGFSTGRTTNEFHRMLADSIVQNGIDVSKLSVMNLDENVEMPDDHPVRGINRLKAQLFHPISLRDDQIHFLQGTASDLVLECRRFEAVIERLGGIDIQFLGIGEDAHLAFNRPGTPFESMCYIVKFTEEERKFKQQKFGFPTLEEVQKSGVTMGIKNIMHAANPVLLAKGSIKAEVIKRSLFGSITTDVPASVLQLHPNLTVLLDEEAAALI